MRRSYLRYQSALNIMDEIKKKDRSQKWPKTKKELNALLTKVETLAGSGSSNVQIAAAIGINYKTFYVWIKKYPELFEAIEQGKHKGMSIVKLKFFNLAKNGDTGAMRWIMTHYDPELKNSPMSEKLRSERRRLDAETERIKLETEALRMQINQQKEQINAQAKTLNDQFVFSLEDVTPVEINTGRILGGYR